MRVLLVYLNRAQEILPAPPIGLAYVATATRRAGHDVRVVDLIGRPSSEVRADLADFAPDVVGLSIRNIGNVVRQRPAWHLGDAAELATVVRNSSRAPIVLGGPAVSILGAEMLRHVDADFAVVGEGEEAFPRLLAAIAAGQPAAGIPGICVRGAGHALAAAPERMASFGASGMEEWIDWRPYARTGATWPIQTRRGCPMLCSYCAYPAVEGRTARVRPPGDVADEIARVRDRIGPRTFEFVDSTFNVPPQHAEALCVEIAQRRLGVRLTAMSVNPLRTSARLFALMRGAGFDSMVITPEAASDPMLASLRKGFTVDDVRRTAELARASGIMSLWFFMLGGPGETRHTVEETVSFVERHLDWRGCVTVFMTGIRVLPGTALHGEAVRDGILPADATLVEPTFYVSRAVEEDWMLDRINRAMRRCPAIVHGAEQGMSAYERAMGRLAAAIGIAPPYWRFLPVLLRVPPVPMLRRWRPPLTASAAAFV